MAKRSTRRMRGAGILNGIIGLFRKQPTSETATAPLTGVVVANPNTGAAEKANSGAAASITTTSLAGNPSAFKGGRRRRRSTRRKARTVRRKAKRSASRKNRASRKAYRKH